MQPCEMNIVDGVIHFLWFACGFVPGYLMAQRRGLMAGLFIGFIAFLFPLFTVNRVRLFFQNKR